jgi:hypothetical protein
MPVDTQPKTAAAEKKIGSRPMVGADFTRERRFRRA